jgi:flavin-dependent dehydrogenase
MQRFDAIVIGGGPAGATAALLLAEAGWSVALIEQKAFPRRKVCGEYLSATNRPLLARLGVAEAFDDLAGPPVRATAIFSGLNQYRAPLPLPRSDGCWGRALSREHLDTLLLARAASRGVCVMQPARCTELKNVGADQIAHIESGQPRRTASVTATTVLAAHGSWETGELATQRRPTPAQSGDWLAFKAHFRASNLSSGLMPLLSFQDGYGGMVHCDGGRASLSCCIRRRRFECLTRPAGESAGEAVLAHMLQSCPVLRPVLDGAAIDGPWLSAGVIQPGIRRCYRNGVFVIGNAAGEAHPVVAEGISMAMQSAWLLVERLKQHRDNLHDPIIRHYIARSYSSAWRRAFAPRIHAAALIAHWAARPELVQLAGPLFRLFPSLITWGARLSGKSHFVVHDDSDSLKTDWCEA